MFGGLRVDVDALFMQVPSVNLDHLSSALERHQNAIDEQVPPPSPPHRHTHTSLNQSPIHWNNKYGACTFFGLLIRFCWRDMESKVQCLSMACEDQGQLFQ